jgi:PAS domain S-box-containing protein
MKKILIIDDDIVLRETTAYFIKGQNFEVFTAEDGLVGVQQTLRHLPDLILCDISMPNMNGLDFYKTIKQIKATSTIPLVFFSARTESEDVRAGMKLGADDYITKPFDFYDLLKVINTRLVKYDAIKQINDEKFNALINHPTLGIFIYQNNQFIFYNTSLANIFGFDYDDFSSINFEKLLDDKNSNKTKILNDFERCSKELESSISLKFEAIHKTSTTVYVELIGSTITYNGQTCIVGNINKLDTENSILFSFKDTKDVPIKLTNRELQVLQLICIGKSTLETSQMLCLGLRTIENYRANLLEKTGSKNVAELIMHAIRYGLIKIGP